jgi:hypothetical protein
MLTQKSSARHLQLSLFYSPLMSTTLALVYVFVQGHSFREDELADRSGRSRLPGTYSSSSTRSPPWLQGLAIMYYLLLDLQYYWEHSTLEYWMKNQKTAATHTSSTVTVILLYTYNNIIITRTYLYDLSL